MDNLEEAKKVFDVEIEALIRVRNSLDNTFIEILNEITNCEGKVIVTGMGKPGHIASKMAATFSSLGTHSFFLHPAEAMHGDLGMVAENDIVLAISYSGESDEVVKLVPIIKMIGARLIVITGNGESSLAQAADIVQVLPDFEEACHLGLAPTSSTTAELVYGDALAVTASSIYGFKDSDFGKLHPAGTLGKKLILKVSDIMAKGERIPMVYANARIIDAMIEMSKKCLSIVCVTDGDGALKGIMTDADLRKGIEKRIDIYDSSIDTVMNNTPKTVYGSDFAVNALQFMNTKSVNVMPVLSEDKKLIGVIHWQQIVRSGIVV